MDVKESIRDSNKIIQNIEKYSEAIIKASDGLKDKAIENAIEYNATKKPYTASSLTKKAVDNDLAKIIKNSKNSFKDFLTATSKYLANNYAINLTKRDLEAISKKGSELVDNLVANTTILKNDIQNILTQNLAKGISEKQLVKELVGLYPAYSRNASTIINTGLARLFTDISVSKFNEGQFQWYIWAGPDDSITRENPCKHWVWHRFPATQLQEITAVRMRLWNCRHTIIPISNDDLENYPIGSINF